MWALLRVLYPKRGEVMSGGNRRFGFALPILVVAVGAYFLVNAMRAGTLKPIALEPVNIAGLAVMASGLVAVFAGRKRDVVKLTGTLVCGVGAVMVFL